MARQLHKALLPCLTAAARGACNSTCTSGLQAIVPAFKLLGTCDFSFRSLHSSLPSQVAQAPDVSKEGEVKLYEPSRKYRPLADKELWHEAWMYEDRFGTEEDPILVPSLEGERIIGVTDPEDDNLVVWGILRANEPPRQFIEGGEYYLLKKVPYVAKVGDVLDTIEGSSATALPK